MAGMLSKGGIPERTAICATVRPFRDGNDDTANIQDAIEGCPEGEVVQLTEGVFTIPDGSFVHVDRAVTLRGAGAGVTVLQRTDGAQMEPGPCCGASPTPIVLMGWSRFFVETGNSVELTADAAKGAYSIRVSDASQFAVGQIVLLDEISGAGWQPDASGASTSVWASPDYRVTWKKHNPSIPGDDFDSRTYPYQSGTNGSQYSRLDRVTNEMKEITSISGNTITFSSPMTISYRVSHAAHVSAYVVNRIPVAHVFNAGLENLSTQNGDDGGIQFLVCAYCWAKGVENSIWTGAGIRFIHSFRNELGDFYNHDATYSRPGGGAYAIAIDWGSSEILVENGISVKANKVMVARAAGAGSVIGYNYADIGFIDYIEGWIEIGLNGSHFVGPHHILFEGNYAFNADSDNTHGASIYMTYFINQLRGMRSPFVNPYDGSTINDAVGGGPLRSAATQAYSYWFSFIGNVLGASGQMSGWKYEGDLTNGQADIWAPGWGYANAAGVWLTDRQMTSSTFPGHMIRDGNFDWVTASQKWHETPAGFAIPNSLYRTSKPAFFGNNPWPWVNPTTGAVGILPAKSRFDVGMPNYVP
jgi:hypothetical protein